MANLLTFLRLLAALPFGFAMYGETRRAAAWAATFFLLAIATDLLDGRVARRRGSATRNTRAFDHTTDFVFVTMGLGAAALRGAIPVWLPLLIPVAFLQYVSDHRAERGGMVLHTNPLGRLNGLLYFVPLGGDILARLGAASLRGPVRLLAWALVVTTVLSMLDRWRRRPCHPRTARDSPSEGTEARSRH
jgi:CDP-diacylglycerol--glycerol-3-phosphate 3-phosphatidyltransferase